MSAGKHAKHADLGGHARKKVVALAAALALVVGVGIGGTLAWLSDQTEPVVNTFTYGDINIKLTETDTNLDGDDSPNTNCYVMMPGETITKDPVVTVEKGSEDCWLFVKLKKSDNFDDFLIYAMADGWTQLKDADGKDVEGVFYREVSKDSVKDEAADFTVIKDNKVSVRESVTKDMLNALDKDSENPTYPTLSVTAYAVQRNGDLEAIDTAYKAWTIATTEPGDESPEVGDENQAGEESDGS